MSARPARAGIPGLTPPGVIGLYRGLPAGDDLEALTGVIRPGDTVLDLGCGAGRLAHPLAEMGCAVTAVDHSQALLAHVRGCETVQAEIETLDLGRAFDVVLLASNLVNTVDTGQRRAFLQACERHLGPDATVVIQRLEPSWATTAQPFESERDGVHYTFADVEADGEILAATVTYRGRGIDATEQFRLRVLDDRGFADALGEAGLRVYRWLDGRGVWALGGRPDRILSPVLPPRLSPPSPRTPA